MSYIAIYPAMHYVAEPEQMERAYTEMLRRNGEESRGLQGKG